MSDTIKKLARRFGDARAGRTLVAVEDAAVPVTFISVDVLAQERQSLPITEEFVLRLVAQGIASIDSIASILGLDSSHVLDAAAAQIAVDNLRKSSDGRLQLTALGKSVAVEMASVRPVESKLPVAFDRVTWKIAPYIETSLLEKRTATESGLRLLPAQRKSKIVAADIPVSDLNAMLPTDDLQILRVRGARTIKHRYFPVQMLVYADEGTGELDLAIVAEDRLADGHALAFAAMGAVGQLGLRYDPTDDRPVLEGDLESQRVALDPLDTGTKEPNTSSSLVRSVSVFEHSDLLQEALTSASNRLLIVSPWIRRAVVNTNFISMLERRLRAGVTITIAHGYGDDDRGSDEDALRKLKNLADRYDKFAFTRVKNTHAKILIFDSNWVSTSFNWLSFKGLFPFQSALTRSAS